MRKVLAIVLALMFALSMSVMVFAEIDAAAEAEATSADVTDDEDVVADDENDGEEAVVEEEEAFEIPVPTKVAVSDQPLMIDGEVVEVQPYNIDGANYFKLRDLAALMSGSGSQFNVDYEAPNMIVTTGEEYEPIDGDLVIGEDKSASCAPSKQVLLVDEEQVDILVYNIGGNNYFQLRGLGELVGFSVDYDNATRTMIVETEGYEPADATDDEGDDEGDDEEGDDEEEE